ncbi:hypothetical protein SmJEL517_g00732 [Synchytrium microbalum]|uniref:Cytosolic Fe-S cluster assembly factor NAR1 n=1 Tax=Synchytrium microbalum TaxID=1806994 RepID=A0A507CDW4_9FUNG|nr:uncharacterized protein SmJEL517_g00732 [Synchytrium microbalum]TPX37701.1 hypothetical protein SmJEL517_g00732 [Synchytrium microbalum]
MANNFSGALLLTDLNDFISPSQACIKPVEVKKTSDSNAAKNEIRIDDTGDYYEISQTGATRLEKATITLNDCLACSGCITSAETVLITQQSQEELYSILDQNRLAREAGLPTKTIVISLSPQSRASFAAKYDMPVLQAHRKLAWFFRQYLGIEYMFDTSFARDFSLLESAREFVAGYRRRAVDGVSVPMLASACPGWICYAEKTHSYILPYIASTKSPQQIMGSLVKDWLASHLNLPASSIYHVSVMPCYDKKLEASRSDFYSDVYATRDVDCVLTTGEVERMFANHQFNFASLLEMDIETNWTKCTVNPLGLPTLLGAEGNSSGGYLSYIFRYAAHELFGISLTARDVELGNDALGVAIKAGRNSDFWEVCLLNPQDPNTPLLKFAAAYGFRNIQNLVRKIKQPNNSTNGIGSVNTTVTAPGSRVSRRAGRQTAESDHHFVEVMACPSGCINGGGQLKPEGDMTTSSSAAGTGKEWVAHAEAAYKSLEATQAPEANQEIWRLYREWLGGEDSEKAHKMLHTQYHAVEAFDVNPLAPMDLITNEVVTFSAIVCAVILLYYGLSTPYYNIIYPKNQSKLSRTHPAELLPAGGRYEDLPHILIVTAHPDDECMFFGPILCTLKSYGLPVALLCFSTGNHQGLGVTRRKELDEACRDFGILDVTCLDEPDLQDNPSCTWKPERISELLNQHISRMKNGCRAIITFDDYGVSGHANHRALFHGAQLYMSSPNKKNPPPPAYSLTSIPLYRKFTSHLDLIYSAAPLRNLFTAQSSPIPIPFAKDELLPVLFVSTSEQYRVSVGAMLKHASQMVWFRWLYITFSRYMVVNDLKKVPHM